MARTSNFANVATVTRASTKTDAGGWDFTNGGTVGTLTEYASGVAAIHPTAGLLVEESTTNEIRNPRCEGAVAGTPGTLPTNWATFTGTFNVIGSGEESGCPYVDLELPAGASGVTRIRLEDTTQIAAATGEDWTLSLGVRQISGDTSHQVTIGIYERTAAGAAVTATDSDHVPTSEHKRIFLSNTLSGGGTVAAIFPTFGITVIGSGAAVYRVYAPQCENKAYPTSPVFPVVSSPAASTRAADDIVVANGAWSNDNGAGTIYADFTFNYDGQASKSPRVFGYGPDASNHVDVYRNAATEEIYALVSDGGVTQASITTSTAPAATDKKVAVAFDTDDFALSVSGGTQQTDTSGTVTLSSAAMEFGQSAGSGNRASSLYLRDLRYWPRRLSNAELEALVGN